MLCGKGFGYICFVIELFNREIVRHRVSLQHDVDFVVNTLNKTNISKTSVFHCVRVTEFVNGLIDNLLDKNTVKRSLSKTPCPYDNTVSENLFGLF